MWFRNKIKRQNEHWENGQIHKTDGPAITSVTPESSFEIWVINGKWHREDGPAYIYKGKYGMIQEWWWYGLRYEFINWLNVATISDEQKALLVLEYN